MPRTTDIDRSIASGLAGNGPNPNTFHWLLIATLLLSLVGCSSQGKRTADGDAIPPEIARIPDAVPKVEPLSRSGNAESYVVRGQRYRTKKSSRGHVERGLASWYGEPFHGRKTSSGEVYDMHAMSAAHKTLPLPTYARVTNVDNGRSVVVRINDRGPFHGPRIIDLSYTAAVKLGVARTGTAMVEVRAVEPKKRRWGLGLFLADQDETRASPSTPASRSARASARQRPPSTGGEKTSSARAPSAARTPSPRIVADRAESPIYLQVGAFGEPGNAERLRSRLMAEHRRDDIRIVEPGVAGAGLYKVRIGPLDSERDAERLSRQLATLGVEAPRRVSN
ncbi:septal ring lytic transglycosylase RlpA family protein [Thiocystis violacea]|uniref:septal ring lytic transglycosylase RlpA family protein n=1 Tax=Thiocystis violacea TaxID=13725 RepID=UPI001905245B|nr:septal ring lytic transglycosylase RlpA family protein [Thiocystis violacea]MBK1716227.1 hypothetical protein [Thiocystis violacea]